MKKLTTNDIIMHMEDGAILRKEYGVYSHWNLILKDGRTISGGHLRKRSPECVRAKVKCEIIESDKTGYSLKLKNAK
jgi:hypothetical protein